PYSRRHTLKATSITCLSLSSRALSSTAGAGALPTLPHLQLIWAPKPWIVAAKVPYPVGAHAGTRDWPRRRVHAHTRAGILGPQEERALRRTWSFSVLTGPEDEELDGTDPLEPEWINFNVVSHFGVLKEAIWDAIDDAMEAQRKVEDAKRWERTARGKRKR